MARRFTLMHVVRNDTRSRSSGDLNFPARSLNPAIGAAPYSVAIAQRARLKFFPRTLLPLAIVITTYVLGACFIPTMAPVAISDDWTYARSVEYLVREGRFH